MISRNGTTMSAPNAGRRTPQARPREILNLVQADDIGCHIITMTNDLIAKIPLVGENLDEFALDRMKVFRRDAQAAGYRL